MLSHLNVFTRYPLSTCYVWGEGALQLCAQRLRGVDVTMYA